MLAFHDPLLDGQLLRTMAHASHGGAEIGECLATAATIASTDREVWLAAWSALADRTLAAADASHGVSARHAYLRAANYYRNAYIFHLAPPLADAARAAYRKQRAAFAKAAATLSITPLVIPYGNTQLHGYFCSGGDGPRRTIISVGGYDSPAEESYFFNGAAAVARGYHCVLFDGPGQGEALLERGVTFQPDYERVIAAVLDVVCARPEVVKVALIGESFGGYLASRGARDRRVAACVLDPPQANLFRAALARFPLPASLKAHLPDGPRWVVAILRKLLGVMARKPTAGWALRRGMLTHGAATPWDYIVDTTRYNQDELIPRITCPVLVCDAAGDDISAFASDVFDALTCPKTYVRFTVEEGAGDHCVMGNRGLYHQRVFDWLDATLA